MLGLERLARDLSACAVLMRVNYHMGLVSCRSHYVKEGSGAQVGNGLHFRFTHAQDGGEVSYQ